MKLIKYRLGVTAAATTLLIAACGGGGDGAGPALPEATPTFTPTLLPTATHTSAPAAFTLALTLPALNISDKGEMTVAGSASGYALTSETPTVCTISGLTVAAYDTGTCTVTASQAGFTSSTKSIAVGNKTWASTSCVPDVPRSGDSIEESADTFNADWGMQRDLGSVTAPNNALMRPRVPVTYQYNYAAAPSDAAPGATTRLTTALVGPSAGIGDIIMPTNNTNGNDTTIVTGEYNAYVPMPVPVTGIPSLSAGAVTAYDIDAAGAIVTPNYWQPKMATKAAFNDKTAPLQEFYPAGWDRMIATELSDKAVNTQSTPINITRRRVGGGALGQYTYYKSSGTLAGASYFQDYYSVTGKLIANTGTTTVKAGKITFTNMCQIEYTMTRLGVGTHTEQADLSPDPSLRGTSGTAADTAAECSDACLLSFSEEEFRNRASYDSGDFKGTFYTHNKVPRVIYKSNADGMNDDNFHSVSLIGGIPDISGGGSKQQPNATYYENKNRSGTNHTYTKFKTLDVSRDWISLP